jgi:hypothetical protein
MLMLLCPALSTAAWPSLALLPSLRGARERFAPSQARTASRPILVDCQRTGRRLGRLLGLPCLIGHATSVHLVVG